MLVSSVSKCVETDTVLDVMREIQALPVWQLTGPDHWPEIDQENPFRRLLALVRLHNMINKV